MGIYQYYYYDIVHGEVITHKENDLENKWLKHTSITRKSKHIDNAEC